MTTGTTQELRADFNRIPRAGCGCNICVEEAFAEYVKRRQASDLIAMTAMTIDEIIGFSPLPTPNAAPQVDTAPLPGTIVSERAKIQAKLDKYFHNLIPDHEIEDRGAFLVWTGYTGAQPLALTWAAVVDNYSTIDKMKGYYGDDSSELIRVKDRAPWVYPSNKPVMVEGLFARADHSDADSDSTEYRRFIPADGVLRYARVFYGDTDADYIRPGSILQFGAAAHPCRMIDMDRRACLSLIDRVLRIRCDIGQITRAERDRRRNIVAQRRDDLNEAGHSAAFWRGMPLSEFKERRGALKNLGDMVRNPDEYPATEFVELLTSLALGRGSQQGMVRLWNERESHGDSVQFAEGCGHLTTDDAAVEVRRMGEATHVCAACNDRLYVYVEDTGDRRLESEVFWHNDDCYRTYGEVELGEDEDEDEGEDSLVQSYSTNVLDTLGADPNIVPSTFGDFLMGVELEVVPRRGARERALEHTNENLCEGYAIMKHDGSLDAGGFEIVTAPRGLKEHIDRFTAWKPHASLRAWDAECCGLHVHISSQAFSQATLGKFIEFINSKDNVRLIRAIAGRHASVDSQAQSYCRVDGDLTPGNPKKTLADKSPERYYMVNTCNLGQSEITRLALTKQHRGKTINTIELRIFRASLKKERLLAQIEFAHAAVMFCRATSMRELGQPAFLAWLQTSAGLYPNLAKWFGVKANTTVIIEAPPAQALAEV